ncbi:Major facilitator superfamily (MFS) metabolite(sugar)/H symporter [Caballeronia glathei]|jgi:putative MFS transporter|uniref:MFS transporter n=1 Tax=Caballeronia glathei TaxID=60547 RepID=A0A069PTJ6_9BURK|nr:MULTISPECIES: MFS transporter [Burkholderiaceae]KDR43920.1 MFS transporter [Caballeronia glathei]TCK38678.1 putative MFS transporter [Paraburkholderia sp. BL8N3]CDY74266.1 Major facilitator superfamily (MFS) metabolite(sugar)/H symporter [Caballeronia glathei]
MYVEKEIVAAGVSARLDRLPPTRFFRGLVARIAIGGWFEFYEMFMAAYIALGLIRSGMYRATTVGLFDVNGFASFLGSFFAGMFVGTVALGGFTDRFGRRAVFTFAMLIYSVATFVAAFQTSPQTMDLWRFIAGIGIGVQLITVDTYISELTPHHTRGRYMAFSILVILTSVPVVAVLSYALVPHAFLGLDGWRWVMIIGSAGAVLIWFMRRGLPESPRWLESKGRLGEALTIVDAIERRVIAETGRALEPPRTGTADAAGEGQGSFAEMWKGRYLRRTVMLSLFNFFQTFGVYGFGAWVPVLLYTKGLTITHSLLYTMVIAFTTPLGALGAMAFAERIERKWQLVGCAVMVAVAGVLFGLARDPLPILLFGGLVTIANNWLIGIFHTYQAELYPTRIRARAVGFVFSWSRVSSIFVGFWVAALLKHSGVPAVFALISSAMFVIVVMVGFFGPKTNGIRLEELSQ